MQLNKLTNKLNFLEEYEKQVYFNKNQLEVIKRLQQTDYLFLA